MSIFGARRSVASMGFLVNLASWVKNLHQKHDLEGNSSYPALIVTLDVPDGPVARHLSNVSADRLSFLEGDSCVVSGLDVQV